jgi:DNA-binding transcriptional LysR family regulator
LCLSDLGELAFLPAVMGRLVAEAPGVALDVVPMQIDRVAEWLERGKVDAAIASVTLPGHARQEVIFRERYVCLLPARLDRGTEALTIEEFCALRHVLIDQSSGHSQADAALAARGVERRGSLRVHHFSVLPGVLANTDLVAIVPFRVAVLFRQLWPVAIKELPVEVQGFDVSLYWQDTLTRSKAHSWFRDLLSRALSNVDMLSGANGMPQA